MRIQINIDVKAEPGDLETFRKYAEVFAGSVGKLIGSNPEGATPGQPSDHVKEVRTAVPESLPLPSTSTEGQGHPDDPGMPGLQGPMPTPEPEPQQGITDDELVVHANILMKKFTGLDDSRASDDPKVRATVRQCGAVFKQIAQHLGFPRPTALPQRKRAEFIEALDKIFIDQNGSIEWLPF